MRINAGECLVWGFLAGLAIIAGVFAWAIAHPLSNVQ